MIVRMINTCEVLGGPVWPVAPTGLCRTPRRPRNTNSGGTPSELAQLGLLWGRQVHSEHLRTSPGRKKNNKLGFWKARVWEEQKVDVFCIDSIGNTSIGLDFYIYKPGKSYPFSKSDYTKFSQIKQLLLGLKLGRPVWPVGPVGLWLAKFGCQH